MYWCLVFILNGVWQTLYLLRWVAKRRERNEWHHSVMSERERDRAAARQVAYRQQIWINNYFFMRCDGWGRHRNEYHHHTYRLMRRWGYIGGNPFPYVVWGLGVHRGRGIETPAPYAHLCNTFFARRKCEKRIDYFKIGLYNTSLYDHRTEAIINRFGSSHPVSLRLPPFSQKRANG